MKSFLIYDSLIKRYILLTVGLIVIALMIGIFFKGILEIDFAIGVICGYLNIFLLLKNYRFPLIPEVEEDSDDLVIYARLTLLLLFVLTEFGFLIVALF
ncbi:MULTISPECIES: hypothetical protein [Acinetobacter calcoaceticus/baumannii complex]|uniref:hypothetical protein n=1 Tax=Acinetobacter calcoaceticus/baumannii complex TaxID=909768 RepID=UPI0002B9D3C4|nr:MULTISPECIES: hypothetical protein [Acinetobacter calcoaceticus/baumannii complex]EHU2951966.1 hypothetical protein [Acinetobacter baumannii]EHU2954475.1 hypothetical protein [Acinetobacter baumannii]KKZ41622.1 hypothetical protein UN98_04175 [Acinetobacter baumannii]MBP1511757.1 hypothetical protein [Acinetobacter nosocomialis]MBP4064830.1 hypothetical protein [Acinetobacter baumannii]